MSLNIRNTKELIDPEHYKLKVLCYALTGTGKTDWAASAKAIGSVGYVACETGLGAGLLTIASQGLDYVTPTSVPEFEAICLGKVFKDRDVVVLDSLSDMARTFIKDYAIAMPRARGESAKRQAGIPELDDYGIMGEVTRRLVRKLLEMDKHIIVTAGERYDKPDPDVPGSTFLIGPDLPGQMFLGSPGMFDLVLRMHARPVLRDPKDAKSRYNQRYFITEQTGTVIAKCRSVIDGRSLLDREEIVDRETGQGSVKYLLNKIQKAYSKSQTEAPKSAGTVVPSN